MQTISFCDHAAQKCHINVTVNSLITNKITKHHDHIKEGLILLWILQGEISQHSLLEYKLLIFCMKKKNNKKNKKYFFSPKMGLKSNSNKMFLSHRWFNVCLLVKVIGHKSTAFCTFKTDSAWYEIMAGSMCSKPRHM